jgi:uncharacterized membrane protein SirB2
LTKQPLLKTLAKSGPQLNKHLLLVVGVLLYLLLMVQVTGSIKHGLEQKMAKVISSQLNYLGMFTQNETKYGEIDKMNY